MASSLYLAAYHALMDIFCERIAVIGKTDIELKWKKENKIKNKTKHYVFYPYDKKNDIRFGTKL